MELPREIWTHVFTFVLDARDLLSLSIVCKSFDRVVQDERMWSRLFHYVRMHTPIKHSLRGHYEQHTKTDEDTYITPEGNNASTNNSNSNSNSSNSTNNNSSSNNNNSNSNNNNAPDEKTAKAIMCHYQRHWGSWLSVPSVTNRSIMDDIQSALENLDDMWLLDDSTTNATSNNSNSDNNNNNTQRTIRIIVTGETGAGKTSLLNKFTQDRFQKEYMPTTQVDMCEKVVGVNGEAVTLQLFDTGSAALSYFPFKGAVDGIVVVFRKDLRAATQSLRVWVEQGVVLPTCFVCFVYSQVDNEEKDEDILKLNTNIMARLYFNACNTRVRNIVQDTHGKRMQYFEQKIIFLPHLNDHFLEISAKDGWNVHLPFHWIASKVTEPPQ